MDHVKTKLRGRKGFTLAELLIVVAIIAVLIAIAVPVFATQLEGSREAVDKANARSASSMAVAAYMLDNPENAAEVTYFFGYSGDETGSLTCQKDTKPSPAIKAKSKDCKSASVSYDGSDITNADAGDLVVVVESGEVKFNSWLTALK